MHCQEGILKYQDTTNLLKDEKAVLIFFLENYNTYSQILETRYFGMVAVSTFLLAFKLGA